MKKFILGIIAWILFLSIPILLYKFTSASDYEVPREIYYITRLMFSVWCILSMVIVIYWHYNPNTQKRFSFSHGKITSVIYDKAVVSKFTDIYYKDLTSCLELTKELYSQRSMTVKFKESLSRILAPLL